MRLELTREVRDDLESLVRFYNSKPSRYGSTLARLFDQAMRKIVANPRIHGLVEDDIEGLEIREYFIERFKQRVIYELRDATIVVHAIVHADRRPGRWHGRIQQPEE